ncbi:FAD/NAD(P)-binding domain-containing protein [Infundibulicybe gibba]|nr:FAD/NAD(P)-binding domain-containing protein [Infundibulicybe gibba]
MSLCSPTARKVVVVGAGPVGCLTALAFAKRGWAVDLYEGRPDIRLASSRATSRQRSINLAISHRGITALEVVDPASAQSFLRTVIPMRGRMVHNLNGNTDSQLYDRDGQCINSIDRTLFNEGLLEEACASPRIRVFFKHKVLAVDFDQKIMTVRDIDTSRDLPITFDFCVGADGTYSVVRRQMMRVVRMDYHQEYIRDEYIELKMPAGRDMDGRPTFLLDPNHLHIWPRHSFMLIALPNKDYTFTCTLFAPSSELDRLDTPNAILAWFKAHFPDAVPILGEKALVNDFIRNPRSPLVCTKSKPYHYKDRVILLGDAAHSMVPFYGQGLNCGLEDVRVLSALLVEEGVEATALPLGDASKNTVDERLARALDRYSENRHKDLVAIADLAMNNYAEMRHSVTTIKYIFRKTLDQILYSLTTRENINSVTSLVPILSRIPFPLGEPKGWLPLYTMVTFRPDISYATARTKAAQQDKIISLVGWVGMLLLGVAGVWASCLVISYHLDVRR